MSGESEFYKFFKNISPSELSKLRGKRKETSTRDKTLLLKKVAEIEEILQKKNIEISVKEGK